MQPTNAADDARIISQPGDLGPFLRGAKVTGKALKEHAVRIEGDTKAAIALLASFGS